MKSTWLKGLEAGRETELRGDFISSKFVRQRLQAMIDEKIETARASVRKKENYELPNFTALVADSIGYERALMEIRSLLDSDEK